MSAFPSLPPVDAADRRHNLVAFCVSLIALGYGLLVLYINGPFGDTRSFWLPWSQPIYDPNVPLWLPHFVYSPVAAIALRPFGLLPFPIFGAMWTALGVAVYAWLLWPLPLVPRSAALAAGVVFALNGNVEWALAFMVVVGMSQPSAWLLAALTKVSPFFGFGWFVLKRDSRAVATTAAIGVLLGLVSAALLPGAWAIWLRMISMFSGQTDLGSQFVPQFPLLARLPIAGLILLWGTIKRQPGVLPLVVLLTQPDLQPWALGYLAAFPRLWSLPSRL